MMTSRPTVLVVDDHVEVCELIGLALREVGHEAVCACDVDAALRALDADPPPALALIDVALSPGDGRDIAAEAERRGIPTLLMTGCPDAVQDLQARGIDHLRKPFRLRDMRNRVAAMLAEAAQPAGAASPSDPPRPGRRAR